MTRYLPLLLGLVGVASAAKPNCATPLIYGMMILDYEEQASFPDPSKSRSVQLDTLTKPLTFCGLVITNNVRAGTLTIQAPSLKSLTGILGPNQFGNSVTQVALLAAVDGRWTPVAEYSVGLSPLIGNDITATRQTLDNGNLAVGATFDGSKIYPVIYNQTTQVIKFPQKTKIVDLYATSAYPLVWQRLSFNLVTNTLTMYKKARIPRN